MAVSPVALWQLHSAARMKSKGLAAKIAENPGDDANGVH
jgi:hypothetical protein